MSVSTSKPSGGFLARSAGRIGRGRIAGHLFPLAFTVRCRRWRWRRVGLVLAPHQSDCVSLDMPQEVESVPPLLRVSSTARSKSRESRLEGISRAERRITADRGETVPEFGRPGAGTGGGGARSVRESRARRT